MIPVTDFELWAMLQFINKDEQRGSLRFANALRVEVRNGVAFMIASDGSAAMAILRKRTDMNDCNFGITRRLLAATANAPVVEGDRVTNQPRLLSIDSVAGNSSSVLVAIDGMLDDPFSYPDNRYPDWRSLIPPHPSLAPGFYDSNVFEKFRSVEPAFLKPLLFFPNDSSAGVYQCGDDFMGVQMPMSLGEPVEPFDIPGWLNPSAIVDDQAKDGEAPDVWDIQSVNGGRDIDVFNATRNFNERFAWGDFKVSMSVDEIATKAMEQGGNNRDGLVKLIKGWR